MKTEKVIIALEKIAEKLGVTAKEIMNVYIKNAKLNRIYYAIDLAISVFLMSIGGLLLYFFIPIEIDNDLSWKAINIIFTSIGGLLCIVGFAFFMSVLSEIRSFINSWVNPEYEAYEDLFGSIF